MNTEDRIWVLVARRLADEATVEQLHELDELLKKYSGIDWQVKIIADWWREGIQEDIDRREGVLFEKIKEMLH